MARTVPFLYFLLFLLFYFSKFKEVNVDLLEGRSTSDDKILEIAGD